MITVRQLNEILELDSSLFDSIFEYKLECVAISEDCSAEELIDNLLIDELDLKFNKIRLILNHKSSYKDIIHFKDKTFKLLPLTKLTLGEYIDLEHFVTKVNGVVYMIPILYRLFEEGGLFMDDKFEEYGTWLEKRKELFLDIDIDEVLGVKEYYINYRESLHNSYQGLFGGSFQEDEEQHKESIQEDRKFTISELDTMSKQKQQEEFNWENIILKLCNNNIADYDKILNTPIIFVFNILSAMKHFDN